MLRVHICIAQCQKLVLMADQRRQCMIRNLSVFAHCAAGSAGQYGAMAMHECSVTLAITNLRNSYQFQTKHTTQYSTIHAQDNGWPLVQTTRACTLSLHSAYVHSARTMKPSPVVQVCHHNTFALPLCQQAKVANGRLSMQSTLHLM